MDLREKALWGFVGVIIVTMVILASLSFFVIRDNYGNLESTYVRSDVNLVTKNIDSEVISLKSNAPDWGAWDETYAFVVGENPDYVQANLVNATFRTLRANFVIITNREGRIYYGQGYNLVSDTPLPLRSDLVAELEQGQILLRTTGGKDGISGFLGLPDGPVILSSYPVLHSNYTGPVQGMVIIGRYVDDAEIRLLTAGTTPSLSIQPFDRSTIQPADLTLLTGSGETAIVVHPLDENTVEGTKVLRDIYGKDTLLLTIQVPRDIYQQGKETILFFILLQLGILLVVGILGIVVLDRMILARMSAISSDITEIARTKGRSARIRTTGSDELSRLAGAMNMLLDQIEKSQSDLQENEQKFREIFNNVNDAIELHEVRNDGLPGKYLEVNDVTCRMLQYSREELLRLSPLDVTPGIHIPALSDIGKEINTLGHSRFETEHRRKDGTVVPVEINAHVVIIDGKTMVLSVVRDITERKTNEDALFLANKKLTILSSITRHDIKNQLLALSGYLELSKRSLDNIHTTSEYIRKEIRITETLGRQIDLTKVYEDMGTADPFWQNINESVQRAVTALPTRDVQVEVDRPDLEIYADPLFEKVFYNLIDNALKYGGESMTKIRISSRETSDGLILVCEDDGSGVPPGEKENIFNRKYFKNTGLGLFLSREILGMTGIGIRETGEPGKGARFEIHVPKNVYRFISGA